MTRLAFDLPLIAVGSAVLIVTYTAFLRGKPRQSWRRRLKLGPWGTAGHFVGWIAVFVGAWDSSRVTGLWVSSGLLVIGLVAGLWVPLWLHNRRSGANG